MLRANVYAGGELDRLARLRTDADWLAARRVDPRSRYLAVWNGLCLVTGDDPPRAAPLPPGALAGLSTDAEAVALLGENSETVYFVVDLSAHDRDMVDGHLAASGDFRDIRGFGGQMPAPEAAMLAYARGLMYWHSRHRFCGACGSPTEVRQAGHVRVCRDQACAIQHFPRTDPAVIMVVGDGDRCLLGRHKDWPEGLYSALAGFVEPGESLEEAVAREVMEEAGVEVRDVRYHSSQPWPFPGSLMLGFHATAASVELVIDGDELEDARWFSRDDLSQPAKTLRLPRPDSIARRLVEDWLHGRSGYRDPREPSD